MNKVILIGNMCKDNDIRQMPNGKIVVNNTIAVKRNFKNSDGNYESDFVNLVIFEPSAKFVEKYISKGDMVAVTGRWQHRTYKGSDGSNRYVDECVVEEIQLCRQSQNNEIKNAPVKPIEEMKDDYGYDDFPF